MHVSTRTPKTAVASAPTTPREPDAARGYGGLETVPWGARDALVALGLALAVIVLIHESVRMLPAPTPLTSPLSTLALELSLLLLATGFSIWKYGLGRATFGWRTCRSRDRSLPLLGAAGMLLSLLVWQAFSVRLHVIVLHPAPNLPVSAFASPLATAVLALTVCLMAPIAEESFFRGFLFRALLHKTLTLKLRGHTWQYHSGFWAALAFNGVIFASAHVQWGLLVPLLAISAVQTWIFWRSGSLWPAIFAHGAFNSIGFALAVKAHFF